MPCNLGTKIKMLWFQHSMCDLINVWNYHKIAYLYILHLWCHSHLALRLDELQLTYLCANRTPCVFQWYHLRIYHIRMMDCNSCKRMTRPLRMMVLHLVEESEAVKGMFQHIKTLVHVPQPSPLLLTSFNLNPIMNEWLYTSWNVRWNYVSILKLQWLIFPGYIYDSLSMLALKLIHVSERGPWRYAAYITYQMHTWNS